MIGNEETFISEEQDEELRQRIAELSRRADELQRSEEQLRERVAMYEHILDAITDMVLVKGPHSRILYANRAFRDFYGMTLEQLQGMIDAPFNEPDYTQQYIKDDALVFSSGRTLDIPEEPVTRHDGKVSYFHTVKSPLFDGGGRVTKTVGVSRDITERKQVAEEQRRLQQQIIEMQELALRELSTPLIPINNHVMVMPLIGALNGQRAQQIMDTLLQGIARSGARTAILDITGVSLVDTQVADAIIRVAQAVGLLGAQVVLTGLRPEIAQALVELGTDLSRIITRSTLQSGIAFAMRQQ